MQGLEESNLLRHVEEDRLRRDSAQRPQVFPEDIKCIHLRTDEVEAVEDSFVL